MHRRLGAVAPLLLVVATSTGLSACGSKKDDSASAPTPTPAAATTPAATSTPDTTEVTTPASTPDATATPAPSADATPAGTTLKVGDSANIDYADLSKPKLKGKIALTVNSITKGTMADFANVQLDSKDKNDTPFYMKVTAKNTGTTDLSGANPTGLVSGVDDRDQQQSSLIMMGTFDKCDTGLEPKVFKPGQSYSRCYIYLIGGGGSIKGAVWTMYDAKTNKQNINWR